MARCERVIRKGILTPTNRTNEILRSMQCGRAASLVSRVCLAEGNAQRLGIDPTEVWKPLPVPDPSLPRTGRAEMASVDLTRFGQTSSRRTHR
jgi:hypothetical protein